MLHPLREEQLYRDISCANLTTALQVGSERVTTNLDVPVLEQNVKNGHDSRQRFRDKVVVLVPPVRRQNDHLEGTQVGRSVGQSVGRTTVVVVVVPKHTSNICLRRETDAQRSLSTYI